MAILRHFTPYSSLLTSHTRSARRIRFREPGRGIRRLLPGSVPDVRIVVSFRRGQREADLGPVDAGVRSSDRERGARRGKERQTIPNDVAQPLAFQEQFPPPLVDDLA